MPTPYDAPAPAGLTLGPAALLPRPGLARRLARGVAAVLTVAMTLAALVPLVPWQPGTGLDDAWGFALNAAVERGLVFGRDLVFTFGPYGTAYARFYHPATDRMMVASTALLAVALSAGLLRLTRERHRLLALGMALFLSQMWLRDSTYFCLPMVFLALACRMAGQDVPQAGAPGRADGRAGRRAAEQAADWAALGLMVLALALVPLVKGTFAVAAGAALGLGTLALALRGWVLGAVALVGACAAAMVLLWVASGQPLAALPGFFASLGEIIRGYTPAMSLTGPGWQVTVYVVAALGVLALHLGLAGPLVAGLRGRGPLLAGLPGAFLLAGSALFLLLAFKAGYVRQDAHVAIAAGALALQAWTLLLGRRGWAPALALAAGLCGWAALDAALEPLTPRFAAERAWRVAADAVQGAWTRLFDPGALDRAYAARLAEIRAEHPMPALDGPTDVYSTGQSVLLAHGMEWSPRPVLQSYSAYTPYLARLDADHLVGPRAPRNLLVALEQIDGRLPAMDDGLSWPRLLSLYDLADFRERWAIMRRRPPSAAEEPRFGPPGLAGQHAPGERVALPGDQKALWATLTLEPSLTGRIVSAVFRTPPVHLVLHFADGRSERHRFIPEVGRAGFLLTPAVMDARQLLGLTLPGSTVLNDRWVTAVTLDVGNRPGLWRPSYALEVREYHVPPHPEVRTILLPQPRPAAQAAAGLGAPPPEAGRCYLEVVNGIVVDHAAAPVLREQMRVQGWGFLAAPEADPETLALTLTAADGTVLQVPARRTVRPDVGRFFGFAQLQAVGFEALFDLSTLRGPYRFGLVMTAQGRRADCPLFPAPASIVRG